MSGNNRQRRKERIDRGIKVRTEGIYALSSLRELSYLSVPRLLLIVGMMGVFRRLETTYARLALQ